MYNRINLEPSIPKNELKVDELYSSYSYFFSPNYRFKGEIHDPWEIVYVNSGEIIVSTPEYEVPLKKGCAFLHEPNEPHKLQANNVASSVLVFSFKCSCDRLYEISRRPLEINNELKNYLFAIVSEGLGYFAGKNAVPRRAHPPEFASGQLIRSLIEILLIRLIRSNGKHAIRAKTEENFYDTAVISAVKRFMWDNIDRKLSLADIAAAVNYSVPRISALFKQSTGNSPINYFIELKIKKAKLLMAENKMSIRQISELLDYDTPQYFAMQFKKVTGFTPSQYIDELRLRNFRFEDADEIQFPD